MWCHEYEIKGIYKLAKPEHEGRKRLFDDKKAILSYLELYPDADGKQLRNVLAPHVTQSYFYITLKRLGITYKKRGQVQKRCELRRAEFNNQRVCIVNAKINLV